MAFNVDGITSESTTNFVGKDGFFWWVGEVEDNEDPMEIGRVKVRILGYYTNFRGGTTGDLPTNYLPWATVLQHTSQAGNDGQGESAGQLQPGAIVLGFFMDGEYAQMPIVIGVMRVEKSDRTLQNRLFSFSNQQIPAGNAVNKSASHPADTNVVNPEAPLRQGTTNVVAYPGQKTTNNGSEGSPKNLGNAKISGSSSNPIKPIDPENPIPVANGVGGPWLSLEYKLAYLIEDLSNNLSTLLKSNEYYLDMVTGKKVTSSELTYRIENYIGAVYAQIISAMRESLVNLATDLGKRKTLTYSSGVPVNVHKNIQSAISKVLTASCTMDANLEKYVDDSIKPVKDVVDKYLASTLDKSELVKQTVDSVVETIAETTKTITTEIGDITKSIKDSVNDTETNNVIQHWEKESTIFALNTNLTEKHKTNLTGLMKILASFTSASCDRKPSYHLAHRHGWFPLYGVTHGTPDLIEKLSKVRGEDGNRLFSLMFNDADPYLTTAKNHPNGSYDLYLATPGRQGEVHKRANGTTYTSISYNNAQYAEKIARDNYRKANPDATDEAVEAYVVEYVKTATGELGDTGNLVADHITYAGVLTQEVHGDDCKLVNKDYARTVEGDYYLKVSGNMHIEVGGGFFLGAEGYAKHGIIQQHQLRFGSDVNMNVVGAKFELQSSESVISSTITKITGSMYENSCDQQNMSGLELNMSSESSISMVTPHLLQLINLENYESPKRLTGLRTVVRGGVELLMDPTDINNYRLSLTNDSSLYKDSIEDPDRYRILRKDVQLTQF